MNPQQDVQDWIRKTVAANDVVLFMKGTEGHAAVRLLGPGRAHPRPPGRRLQGINVLEDLEIREGIKAFSNWPTIPQLYVKGEFVGGCDIVREMSQAGELQQLSEKRVTADEKS